MRVFLTFLIGVISFNLMAQNAEIEEAQLTIQYLDSTEANLKWTESGYVYSQPVREDFFINTLSDDEFKLIVFNSFGEKMIYLEGQSGLIAVEASELNQGTYYCVLTGGKYRKSFKFTKV